MGAARRIYRATNPDENVTLLYFVRSVVQSYLHVDRITKAPTTDFWKTKKLVDDSTRLTGRSHWPAHIQKQRSCQYPSYSSKVRTICKECDVALCINGDHSKLYHTTK